MHHLGDAEAAQRRYAEAAARLDPTSAAALRFGGMRVLALLDLGDVAEARELAASLPLAEDPRTRGTGELVARGLAAADDPAARRAFSEEVRELLGSARFQRDYHW